MGCIAGDTRLPGAQAAIKRLAGLDEDPRRIFLISFPAENASRFLFNTVSHLRNQGLHQPPAGFILLIIEEAAFEDAIKEGFITDDRFTQVMFQRTGNKSQLHHALPVTHPSTGTIEDNVGGIAAFTAHGRFGRCGCFDRIRGGRDQN